MPAPRALALRTTVVTYPGSTEHIRAVRADLPPLLRDCPVADEVILCASELAANAAIHSHSRLPGGTFTVCTTISPGHYARIEVEDSGGPWTPANSDPTRPHGLEIVRALASDWGIEEGHTTRTIWQDSIGLATHTSIRRRQAAKEQRDQLDRTLTEQRTRTLNERFITAADKLGSDKPPAVRLAGVYALAGLADDWPENRQTCVDVLCAYLRLPYEPDPGDDAPALEWLAFQASREVRHTVIRVITAHLKDGAAVSWQGLNFDFTGVVFDGGDFSGAQFSGGRVGFISAKFSGGLVDFGPTGFTGTEFSGGQLDFTGAEFSGSRVDFTRAKFSGSQVDFSNAADWSHPPGFDWDSHPPAGVKLPAAAQDESR